MLLKDNIINDINKLNFVGSNHQLGNFFLSKTKGFELKTINFKLPFNMPGIEDKLTILLTYSHDEKNSLKNGWLTSMIIFNENINKSIVECKYSSNENWEISIDFKYFRKEIDKQATKIEEYFKTEEHVETYPEFEYEYERSFKNDKNSLTWIPYLYCKPYYERFIIGSFYKRFKYKKNEPLFDYFFLFSSNKESLIRDNKFSTLAHFEKFKNFEAEYNLPKDENQLKERIIEEELALFNITFNSEEGVIPSKYYNCTNSLIDIINQLEYTPNIETLFTNKELDLNKNFVYKYRELVNKMDSNYSNIYYFFELNAHIFFDEYVKTIIKEGFECLKKYFNTFSYLGVLRGNQRIIYSYDNNETSINELLLLYSEKNLNKFEIITNFLNFWIKEFTSFKKYEINTIEESNGIVFKIGDFNISQTGYGFSQFLPILLKIVIQSFEHSDNIIYDKPIFISSVLYIEEPECNLHPNLQSKLADLFVDASKRFKVQFILETHSEYLIRKLQYLTAKNEIKPNDSVIYYFNDKENELKITIINIKEDGRLSKPFGSGFFDESSKLMVATLTGENLN